MGPVSASFDIFGGPDAPLARLGDLKERYFKDPNRSLIKLQQHGEVLAHLGARRLRAVVRGSGSREFSISQRQYGLQRQLVVCSDGLLERGDYDNKRPAKQYRTIEQGGKQ